MAKRSKKVTKLVFNKETDTIQFIRIKRTRGGKSFETSGRLRRKLYNRYSKEWERLNSLYQGNISGKLSFDEFIDEFARTRKENKLINKSTTVSNFSQSQLLVTRSQSSSAADNFNAHLDSIKAKIENGIELTGFEKEIMLAFGNDKLTQRDVRSKSAKYQAAYRIARDHDVGSEAFGS